MLLTKILNSVNGAFRTVKLRVRGGFDIRTAEPIAAYGDDSNPIADAEAVYASTESTTSPRYVIGYRIKEPIAGIGEKRLYSTNTTGTEQARVWIRANGKVNIAGTGSSDNPNHAAQYEGLKTAFDQFKTDFNNLVTVFNAHTHVYTPGTGTPTTSAVPASPGSDTSADISTAKIDKILVP